MGILVAGLLVVLTGCSRKSPHAVVISAGDLTVTFVDNAEMPPEHRAGYNGIARLAHVEEPDPIFVPAYAGFNLEHIFAGDSLPDLFEPRHAPMELRQLTDRAVELHQPATPFSHVESWTRFEVVPPNAIDVTFRCQLHDLTFFRHGYAGLFWASYIHAPEDKRIWFWGVSPDEPVPHWIGAYSEKHGLASTHLSVKDSLTLYFAPNFQATLASHFSDYRYVLPFFFGRFHKMVLIYVFDDDRRIRFSQSPTGGGATNPAWDFQFIIPKPRVDSTYGFQARLIYKPFVDEEDVKAEALRWLKAKQLQNR